MLRSRSAHSLIAVTAFGALALSGCAVNEGGDTPSDLSGTLNIGGSSAQSVAQQVWSSRFQSENAGVTINYDPVGSGAGRGQLTAGGYDIAGTDAPVLEAFEGDGTQRCAAGAGIRNAPVYVSPIVLAFNVPGVDELRLDAATIAGIFTGDVTSWDAAAIRALNPDIALPELPISPVHRSDSSGTTENFTEYLHEAAPDVWTNEPSGEFPFGGEAAQGSSGVANAVRAGSGSIGYVDASVAGDFTTVQVQVGDEFVAFSPDAASRALAASSLELRPDPYDLVLDVDRRTTASGAYPIVLVSYLSFCSAYVDADDAEIVRAYLTEIAGDVYQQAAAEAAGSAPLPDELAARVVLSAENIG